MELTFERRLCDCLRPAVRNVNNDEQTQEVKLPDAMPDIGMVLCAWGQVLIRGKEWRSGSMGASGGVMAWVLYAPEDGSEARVVETWLPFQLRWDFPETERDGTIRVAPALRSVDARSVSARKLMVRACVSVLGEAYEPVKLEYSIPGELPEDVQLLKNNYPVKLLKEAGEKAFVLDEELLLPSSCPKVEKLIYYTLQPEIIDRKVMGDKVVFRGAALVHILYRTDDGSMKTWDFEVPFSQYSEMEREYDPNAAADITCVVTSLELEPDEQGSLRLKAGLAGQYVIYGTDVLEIAEDAYSPARPVEVQGCALRLPTVLDICRETLHSEASVQMDGMQIVDLFSCLEQPAERRGMEEVNLEIPQTYQMLYYDSEGKPQCALTKHPLDWTLACDDSAKISASVAPSGKIQAAMGSGSASIRADLAAQAVVMAEEGIPMVTGLELGEMTQPDPGRPSLVLKRAGKHRLWDLAKQCGTTVDTIRQANSLTGEAEEGQILLIPIV